MSAGLSLSSPLSGMAVSLLDEDWKNILLARTLTPRDGEGYGIAEDVHFPEPVRFAWQGGAAPYRLEVTSPDAPARTLDGLAEPRAALFNLHVATRYHWRVTDAAGAAAEADFRTAATPRLIALPDPLPAGPVNVRDIGGAPSAFGGRVRQGLLYRGSAFSFFQPFGEANRRFLREALGIRCDLDLRYETQVGDQRESELGADIAWRRYHINAYKPFTNEQNDLWRDTFRALADPKLYPVYCHCSGGIDRTGEVVILLQAILGMGEEQIFTEYELSSLSFFPRARTIPYLQAWLQRIAASSPNGGNLMQQAENYLRTIGITDDEIASMRNIFLGWNGIPTNDGVLARVRTPEMIGAALQ